MEDPCSGGLRMTHAAHLSPFENRVRELQTHGSRLSSKAFVEYMIERYAQRDGRLTLRGPSDDACVPFESDGKSSSGASNDATRVQSIPISTFLQGRGHGNRLSIKALVKYMNGRGAQRDGRLTLRGPSDDACVPFESDGKSSSRASSDATDVQSISLSTFLQGVGHGNRLSIKALVKYMNGRGVQRDGRLILRGPSDDACVPFESDEKSSSGASSDVIRVQSIPISTFLQGGHARSFAPCTPIQHRDSNESPFNGGGGGNLPIGCD